MWMTHDEMGPRHYPPALTLALLLSRRRHTRDRTASAG